MRSKWAFWEASAMLRKLYAHLGLIPTRETIGPEISLDALLYQPWEEVIWSKWNCCSCPSNVVLFFGLRSKESASVLPLGSGIFTKASCLWIVASHSSSKEDWGQGQSTFPSCWGHSKLLFFFGYIMWPVGSQFPNQGLNPGHGSETIH